MLLLSSLQHCFVLKWRWKFLATVCGLERVTSEFASYQDLTGPIKLDYLKK